MIKYIYITVGPMNFVLFTRIAIFYNALLMCLRNGNFKRRGVDAQRQMCNLWSIVNTHEDSPNHTISFLLQQY